MCCSIFNYDNKDHLKVSVKQVVDVKVLVVIAKRVDQHLGDVQPAKVEEELEQRGKWNRKIKSVHILRVPNVVLGVRGACGNLHPIKMLTILLSKKFKPSPTLPGFPRLRFVRFSSSTSVSVS